MSSDVKVGIKLRPLIKREKDENLSVQWIVKGNSIVSLDQKTKKWGEDGFHFDYVFDINTTNAHVFDSIIKPIVDAAIDGYNGTVFCYGQFDSGKTYTMTGTSEDLGIIPHTIEYIINVISTITKREFLLRVSYLEVCDEKVCDLLNKNEVDLELYKDDNGQIVVNCKEEITNSANNMLSIMRRGIKNKKKQEINRNECVTSHSIFRVIIESQYIEGDSKNVVQVSQLNFVDLAGFEKVRSMDVIAGEQTEVSLSFLESQINLLNESRNLQEHTDSHGSKLTKLLQSSLRGNAVTAIICTVTPVALEETYHTLSFASRARDIKTKPERNEVISDTPLLIRYAEQLSKLQTELEGMRNGNAYPEPEEIETNKLLQKYDIDYLLEERIKLLKSQILSGSPRNCDDAYKHKSRRRQNSCNSATHKQYLPIIHQSKTGLPTIEEMSPEKPYKRNIMRSADVINQTLHTAFTDFELELIDCEAAYETKDNSFSRSTRCTGNESSEGSRTENYFLTPEKQDSSVQTSSNHASPSTPKSVLRKYILDLTRDLTELREFTTLEKQLMCEENHCCAHNSEEELAKQPHCPTMRCKGPEKYTPDLILQLEEEKVKLAEDLELKIHELNEIKKDIHSLKLDIKELEETIYLLTNENAEMSNKLSAEKERSRRTEQNLQRTIDELYARVSRITDEKINLESEVALLNEQLESLSSKASEVSGNEQLVMTRLQSRIDTLKNENIELSTIIEQKNKELEGIKESKTLLYDHECIHKERILSLERRNECLVTENNELSTDLMDKIEENDMLREQCEILKNKASSMENADTDGNVDVEQLRSENTILRAEIVELKMRINILSDENARFSCSLLETMEDLDNSRNEKLSNSSPHPGSTEPGTPVRTKVANEESQEELAKKVATLQDKVNHLSRLNKKLSDLKLASCSQCAHLKNLNDSRRALKLEAKMLNHKLKDLQNKFDRKCADTEALKLKVNQEMNLSFGETTLNSSITDGMNVSFVEERVLSLSSELQALKDDRDKLSVLYREKCGELEKLHDEVVDGGKHNTWDASAKPKKHVFHKNETRIEQIQKSIDQVKNDIDELKKNSTNFASILGKFRAEKASLLDEINALKSMNEELQQRVSDKEILEATANERAQILENELLNMSKEIQQYSAQEKIIRSEKLTLEVELEDLKAEKENRDALISGLHRTIDDLNECITSLKTELDQVMCQKNELSSSSETTERRYRDELELLRKQCDEIEREKLESLEAKTRATLWAKELETDVEKLQTDLEKQECLYKELQRKVSELESLLEESKNEKATLAEKLQALEIELIDSKENTMVKYKNEFETISRNFEEYTKESELKLNKINETLKKYVEENDNLTQQLSKLRDIECKFRNLQDECTCKVVRASASSDNKLKEELNTVKEQMIKELKSLKYKVNSADFLNKTADEIFIIFLQTLMSKEEEIIKKMRELFEKDKQKLEDEVRQRADAEKRVMLWAKELETEIEKLQTDMTAKENLCREHQDTVYQLEHLLRESKYEKEILKDKLEALENDFSNLQSEFDKHCKVDIQQKEEAVIVAQKREKEAIEALKNKEIELRSKISSEKEEYERRIEELICTIEDYKTKNMELKGNIEGLEANEKQLKNIIEANATELKINEQTIHKMSLDFEQLTEAYNEVNRELEQKTSRIEDITALLKNKCDSLSEYKSKLDIVMPDYEMLRNQIRERKDSIERYKEEIEKLKMEKEKEIEMMGDKLNSEEIKNVGLSKQLNELNNKNVTLIEELDTLKEKYEELQRTNAKLERKIRNSTSKVKAEAEMDDLRDMNRRLQNNLEGASNRITELQEGKNKILKELVNLRGQYELRSQENIEIKKTLAVYKAKQDSVPCFSQDSSKYDELIQEKNKVALELEDKKLLLSQKEKEVREHVGEIKNLTVKQRELDNQLKEYAMIIRNRDIEISELKEKLHIQQCENKVVSELGEKIKILEQENRNLEEQLRTFNVKSQVNIKHVEDKLLNEKVYHHLQREKSELQMKLYDYENKLELKSNSGSSKSVSPAFENSRRRRSRNEIFNQRRQLESVTLDVDLDEDEETCHVLRQKIQELELQLVSKNGQIAALEVQIQSENFPYQQKCKELEELLLAFRKKNSELSSETRKLQRTLNDINAWECDTCRRWRINRREQACQTTLSNIPESFSVKNDMMDENGKIMKLEKEKAIIKDICRARCRQVKDLEDKIRELEEAQMSCSKRIEFLQEKSNTQYTATMHFKKQLDSEKNKKSAMKENVPTNILELKKPSNCRRAVWNNY